MKKFLILNNNIIINPFGKLKRNLTDEQRECVYCRCSSLNCSMGRIGSYCNQFTIKRNYNEAIYSPSDIDDYLGKINISDLEDFLLNDTKNIGPSLRVKQGLQLLKHCNDKNIKPIICAWYDDIDEVYEDYNEHCGYSKSETKQILKDDSNMFCRFFNGEIVKLSY